MMRQHMSNASLADLRIRELLVLISSNSVTPGAGAAGALTLALAAACASKAVSITLKHSPHDTRLAPALSALEKILGFSLQGADADSRAFADFLAHKNPARAAELIKTGEAMAHLIDALVAIIDDLESHVRSSMTGDLIAAKSLASAARTIQSTNEAEAKEDQRAMAQHTESNPPS
jgi:formiminotetrahydrofolate cyclodeaminase